MVKIRRNNKAFTVVEILLTMSILGFIILMTTMNAVRQAPDLNKARYKKAYLVIEQTVADIINDDNVYPSAFQGLRYTDTVQTEFGEILGQNKSDKFRDMFIFALDPVEENINCDCIVDCQKKCFKTDDGIVYGIPDTDFLNIGMLENRYYIDSKNKNREFFVPITIYTNWEKTKKSNNQIDDAMYVGVQYDGNIRIFYPEECAKSDTRRFCKAQAYLMSDTVKRKAE